MPSTFLYHEQQTKASHSVAGGMVPRLGVRLGTRALRKGVHITAHQALTPSQKKVPDLRDKPNMDMKVRELQGGKSIHSTNGGFRK